MTKTEPFANAVETFTKRKSRWPQRPVGAFDVAVKVYAGESRKFNEADWQRNSGRFANYIGQSGGGGGKRGGAGAAEASAKKAGTTLKEWDVSRHKDTQQLYSPGKDGKYPPGRKAIHDAMIADVTRGIPVRPEGERTFYVLGGGGGSGKTYLVDHGKLPVPKADDRQAVLINADDAKARLPEYKGLQDAGNTSQAARVVHEESSDMTKEQMKASRDGGHDYVLDGVGDGSVNGLRDKAQAARDAGYAVKGYYVATDVNRAVSAAKKRAITPGDKSFGRVVPEARLRADHRSVSKILPKAIDDGVFDEVEVWDNQFDGNPTKVFSAKKNPDGSMTKTVHDEARWQTFLDKGNQTLHLSEIRQKAQDMRTEAGKALDWYDLTNIIGIRNNNSGGAGDKRRLKVKVDKDGYTDIPARNIEPEDDQKIYMAAFGSNAKFPAGVPDNAETRELFEVYKAAILESAKDGVVATTAED